MMIAPPRLARPKPLPALRQPLLLVAEQSRFNLAGRIDHFWACDDCGTEFATSIEVTRHAVA
jgi:hypothetical protein